MRAVASCAISRRTGIAHEKVNKACARAHAPVLVWSRSALSISFGTRSFCVRMHEDELPLSAHAQSPALQSPKTAGHVRHETG